MIRLILLFIPILFPLLTRAQLDNNDKELLRKELANRINDLRISKGLKPLIFNDTLKKASEIHSKYMAETDILSHDEKKSTQATPEKRVKSAGGKNFKTVGENVLVSSPQKFPLSKKDIEVLADEMFEIWKKSPGHYANMTEPEYVFADLGFETSKKNGTIYATQVFGTKGHVVENQLSKNSFGLTQAQRDCEAEYESYSNIIMNLGNHLEINGNEVILYHQNIELFKKIFKDPNDGIAIDLVARDQLECGQPNQLDLSPVYDGILLKPVYAKELIANNTAEGNYRIITKVADIPDNLPAKEYSPSLIIINNGQSCKYLYPAFLERDDYPLQFVEPKVFDEVNIKFSQEGIVRTQIVNYDFKTDLTNALALPKIEKSDANVHSIQINSFSSVEGNSDHNKNLHNARAQLIKDHLEEKLKVSEKIMTVNSKENWDLMNFQLAYYKRDELSHLSHDSIKKLIALNDVSLPWDSLLFDQRKAQGIINYWGRYNDINSLQSLESMNLRTAVATNNIGLANKALYTMYQNKEYEKGILFEPQILEFISKNPKTVANFSAVLTFEFQNDPYATTRFIYNWLNRIDQLDDAARSNLICLYCHVSSFLLQKWDVSAERLSNVIHPLKIEKLAPATIEEKLMLNMHLTFIKYFGQINDSPNISKSFYFIADYFKEHALDMDDDVKIALFFNNWSMQEMTIDYLLSKFDKNRINENGLFVLAETMNFSHYKDESGKYFDVHKKAIELNKTRWCEWLNDDFQLKRNHQIKRIYCETCQ